MPVKVAKEAGEECIKGKAVVELEAEWDAKVEVPIHVKGKVVVELDRDRENKY